MKPVDQTKLASPTVKGNCYAACLASVLERPIDQVFEVWDHGDRWADGLQKWLFENGLTMLTVSARELEPGQFAIASGKSPRNPQNGHAVVWQDGKCVHDPHPDRTGLDGEPWHFQVLEAVASGQDEAV